MNAARVAYPLLYGRASLAKKTKNELDETGWRKIGTTVPKIE